MNEKRFTFGPVSPNFAMIKDNGEPMDTEEVVDRLNKQQITIQSLKEENEKLKHYKLYEDNKRLQIIIADLKKENEQLRQKLECYEYKHFKKELDKIHEKVEKGDLNDFCTLTISDKGLEHWNGVLK